jgi:hypothetical protein
MQIQNQSNNQHELHFSIHFNRDDLELEYSLIGIIAHLSQCPTAGEPGGPALPTGSVKVALPPNTQITDLQAEAIHTSLVSDEILPSAPLQPLRPGSMNLPEGGDTFHYYRPEEKKYDNIKKLNLGKLDESTIKPLAVPQFVPAKVELYYESIRRPVACLVDTKVEGLTPVATINLNPVKLTSEGLLEFTSQIELTLCYEPIIDSAQENHSPANITSRAQAMRQIALTQMSVVNPDGVYDFSDDLPILRRFPDYLVITDNQRWNAETVTPIGPVNGDLVASFNRLVQWKRKRGLKAWVVTISDIVAGRYGDFCTGSRDLQEVIRKFLKMAHKCWGIAWVLLGGDTEIVPIRQVAGAMRGHIQLQTLSPPPPPPAEPSKEEGPFKSFWTGDYLQIRVKAGNRFIANTSYLLVRPNNGLLIPYDSNGSSDENTRGWFFTTDDTYRERSFDPLTNESIPTDFVRVNGPAAEINADLQFLYEKNMIPTDLYYSSLVGSMYNQPGKHDWDLVDNGIYGQHFVPPINWHEPDVEVRYDVIDGVDFNPDVSLGRAPVRDAAEADVFVNKVLAYEKYESLNDLPLDHINWTSRVVLASTNWSDYLEIKQDPHNPPRNNHYHNPKGQSYSLIQLTDIADFSWSLLAFIAEGDVRLLPYRSDAAEVGRGWYFARSNIDLSPNSCPILLGGKIIELPCPSKWIAVYGTVDELTPFQYILNKITTDLSLIDQEQLRQQMENEMPGFKHIKRLYQDIDDMTPQQIAAGHVERITEQSVKNALNEGPHIVSLSGHGTWYDCCYINCPLADSLTNGNRTFIVYADSCSTNELDSDALSEHLLRNPNGGAVAYIGNTRYSWIGIGDDFQRQFFKRWSDLGGNAHLGLLNDTRAQYINDKALYWGVSRWAVLSLNLMGDPEMPLWWREPLIFDLPEVQPIDIDEDKIELNIDLPVPPVPPPKLIYRKNWGVTHIHLQQGEHEQVLIANPDGKIDDSLTDFEAGAAILTVTRPGYKPIVKQVDLSELKPKRPIGILASLALILLSLLGTLLLARTRF